MLRLQFTKPTFVIIFNGVCKFFLEQFLGGLRSPAQFLYTINISNWICNIFWTISLESGGLLPKFYTLLILLMGYLIFLDDFFRGSRSPPLIGKCKINGKKYFCFM